MAYYNGTFMRFISAVNIGLWITREGMHVWYKLPHAQYKIINTQIYTQAFKHHVRGSKNRYSNDIDLIEIEIEIEMQ